MKCIWLTFVAFASLLGCEKSEMRASSLKSLVMQASNITPQGYRDLIDGYEYRTCGSERFVYWQAGSGDSSFVPDYIASRVVEIVCNEDSVRRDVKLLELYGGLSDVEFERLSPYVRSWLWLRLGNSLKDDRCFACSDCVSQNGLEFNLLWLKEAKLQSEQVRKIIGAIDSVVSLVKVGRISDPAKSLRLVIDPAIGVDFVCPR